MAGEKRDEINGRQSKDSGVLNTKAFTAILSQMFDVLPFGLKATVCNAAPATATRGETAN